MATNLSLDGVAGELGTACAPGGTSLTKSASLAAPLVAAGPLVCGPGPAPASGVAPETVPCCSSWLGRGANGDTSRAAIRGLSTFSLSLSSSWRSRLPRQSSSKFSLIACPLTSDFSGRDGSATPLVATASLTEAQACSELTLTGSSCRLKSSPCKEHKVSCNLLVRRCSSLSCSAARRFSMRDPSRCFCRETSCFSNRRSLDASSSRTSANWTCIVLVGEDPADSSVTRRSINR
mmetsp:Transcript_62010/g.134451  ORF Transcript_62010/g.134451 Transcript_62010/m.134451 type:complete len:235 (-) Transcript_62010:442-1146(-)